MKAQSAIFAALAKSPFRCRFRLGAKERQYLETRGLGAILSHAAEFVSKRLAPALPATDGHQTPMRGHPVFIAQHATATCCRGCLATWHDIPAGRPLSADEEAHIVDVIGVWLAADMAKPAPPERPLRKPQAKTNAPRLI